MIEDNNQDEGQPQELNDSSLGCETLCSWIWPNLESRDK